MELITEGKALSLAIATLSKDLKATIAVIENLAQSATLFAVKTGNVTHLNKLATATAHIGSRALMRWIAKHAPVTYDATTKGFVINEKKQEAAKKDVEAFTKKIADAPGFVASAKKGDENPFHSFRFVDRVKALIAQAEEIAKDEARKGKSDAKGRADDLAGIEAVKVALAAITPKISAVQAAPASKTKSSKGRTISAPAAEAVH